MSTTTTYTFEWESIDPADPTAEWEVFTDDDTDEAPGVWGVARPDGSWEIGWDRASVVVFDKDEQAASGRELDLDTAKAAVEAAIVDELAG